MLQTRFLSTFVTSRVAITARAAFFSTSSTSETGTVKFYFRNKAYGFLISDNDPNTDIFVHRKDIHCTVPVPENTTKVPYLRKSERVRFEKTVTENGMVQAKNVSFVNGQGIPPERVSYLGAVYERTHHHLGAATYKILQQSGVSDEVKLEQIKATYQDALANVKRAELYLTKLGMDLSTFPLVKQDRGQGRYQFEKATEATTEASSSTITTEAASVANDATASTISSTEETAPPPPSSPPPGSFAAMAEATKS